MNINDMDALIEIDTNGDKYSWNEEYGIFSVAGNGKIRFAPRWRDPTSRYNPDWNEFELDDCVDSLVEA